MRRTKKTALASFVSLAVAAAIAAWVFLATESLEVESAGDLYHLIPDSFPRIDKLIIERQGDVGPIVLERQGDSWRLSAPVAAPADESEVASLLLVLRALSTQTVAAPIGRDGTDMAPFGLEQPFISLTIEGGGDSRRLHFGAVSPFDGRLYCRAEGEPILLVDGNVRFSLNRSAFDLREKRLVRFSDSLVGFLEVGLSGGGYRVERVDDSDWRLIADGIEDRADTGEVLRILSLLRGLAAIGFPDAGGARSADFNDPSVTVRLEFIDDQPGFEIAIAEWMDGEIRRHLARGSPIGELVEVPGDAVRRLRVEPAQLRYRRILHFATEDVAQVEIRHDADRYLVERSSNEPATWRLIEPVEDEAEAWRMNAILSTLSSLKAESVVIEAIEDASLGPEEMGLRQPAVSIRLLGEDGELLDALEIGSRASRRGLVYATNARRQRVYTLPESRLVNIPRSLEDVQRRRP